MELIPSPQHDENGHENGREHHPANGVQNDAEPVAAALDPEGKEIWREVLTALRLQLPNKVFEEFFPSITANYYDHRSIVIKVPNAYHRNWIESNALEIISERLAELNDGKPVSVEMHIEPAGQMTSTLDWIAGEPGGSAERDSAPSAKPARPREGRYRGPAIRSGVKGLPAPRPSSGEIDAPAGEEGASPDEGPWSADAKKAARGKSCLDPRYTFENFVIGENNRFAHAAALRVSDPDLSPRVHNPLFIYGGVGLGKTHLMHAIGLRLLEQSPGKKVVYATSEQFMNDFIDSISSRVPMEFRSLYRNVDLLLLDDAQFFIGKEQTQAEFFHTFNELYVSGRRIVLSSDRPPKDLQPLEERLRSRFEGGVIADIQTPNLETRAAIARKKAEADKVLLPQEVAFYIAEHVSSNVRELEGALQRLIACATVQDRPIDMELCVETLSYLIAGSTETPPNSDAKAAVERILRATCEYFSIDLSELLGASRVKKLTKPRHVAQYLARQLAGLSFPEIGEKFGGRDHTSVMHACRKIEREMQGDPQMANCVNFLTKRLQGGKSLKE
jgi:chromosomal replication initiator protein